MIDFTFTSKEYKKADIITISEQRFDLFDDATQKTFKKLKGDISKNEEILPILNSRLSNFGGDNDGIPLPEDMGIIDEMMNLNGDNYWSTEHLNVLSEMKIVYLFKSVEITMKSLIKTAYPQVNTRDFYQWENMASYFKSINIKISNFDGYIEAIELRKVNNSIKHNSEINEEIDKIREFSGESLYTYTNIENFYSRVKPKVHIFIKLLGRAIIDDLFIFNSDRIEQLSNDFKSRMEENDLKALISKLSEGNASTDFNY